MGAKALIKTVMVQKDIKSGYIAEQLEMDKQVFYNWLNRDKMTVSNLVRVANVLGCDVVLRDRETGKIYD